MNIFILKCACNSFSIQRADFCKMQEIKKSIACPTIWSRQGLVSSLAHDKQLCIKGKCAQEGTFFANRFPSLGNFVNKKVRF